MDHTRSPDDALLPLVLHVLPVDLARGAQRYAHAMRHALDGVDARHRTLTIFESSRSALDADLELGVRPSNWAHVGFDPRVVPALRAIVMGSGARIVVAHGSQPLKYLAAALPRRTTIIYYKIGIAHAAARRFFRRAFHTTLLRRATCVAGVSQECLDEAEHLFGVPGERLRLIPNGRDPAVFFPGNREAPGPPVLAFVGHLGDSKRPDLFLRLVERFKADRIPCEAWMAGDGPLYEVVAKRARDTGVRFLGRRDDIPELLRGSDLVVFTSVPDGEGMPGVFIEAGLSGLPVVSTDVPGARTVIRDGETGYVVPVDDFERLYRRARQLVEQETLRRRLGQAARARCQSEFSMDRSLAEWARLIRQILPTNANLGAGTLR